MYLYAFAPKLTTAKSLKYAEVSQHASRKQTGCAYSLVGIAERRQVGADQNLTNLSCTPRADAQDLAYHFRPVPAGFFSLVV